MKLDNLAAIALALCASGCAKGPRTGAEQVSSAVGRISNRDDQGFISSMSKKQEESLARLAEQRAAEKALREQTSPARETVPPSMYRTTEPALPEPDLSLPVTDVPRSAPGTKPTPTATPTPVATPWPNGSSTPSGSPKPG
jgi:hypothetical protein